MIPRQLLLLLALVAVGFVGDAPRTHAAPGKPPTPRAPRVVIVSYARCCVARAWAGAEQRLAAELRTLGVRVRWTHARGSIPADPTEPLTRAALRGHAFAAVRILRGPTPAGGTPTVGHGVIIAWHERLTGKTSIRRGRVARLDRRTEALVALQAVELLRASLLEARAGAPRPTGRQHRSWEIPPLPAKLRPRPPRPPTPATPLQRRRWALRLAGSLLVLPGGPDPRAGAALVLRLWVHRWLSVEVQADMTPFGQDLEVRDRRTAVRYYGASAALLWEAGGPAAWRGRPWRLQPALGLLAGARLVHIQGWDTFDLLGASSLHVQADLAVGAQLALRLAGPVRLRATLQGGVLLPPIGVLYPSGRVATIGPGYVAAQLGLEIAW